MAKPKIESMFPLTPMQEALLLRHHARIDQDDPGLLCLVSRLRGALDVPRFDQAVRDVVARHAALRTAVHFEDLPRPIQITHKSVEVTVEHVQVADEAALDQLRDAERRRGLDIRKAPVGRFVVASFDDQRHALIWTCHHILVDGWSGAIVLGEILELYDASSAGRAAELHVPRPFGEFLRWQAGQAPNGGRAFWADVLSGFQNPTPLPGAATQVDVSRSGLATVATELDVPRTERIRAAAKRHGVTISTVLQAAWALMLGRASDRGDVVFGTTVSGRPPALDGVDTMVGLFTNTLPVRVRRSGDTLQSWLHAIHANQAEFETHQGVSLGDITAYSDIDGPVLFDSLLVIENYPHSTLGRADRALVVDGFSGAVTSTTSLTLVLTPGDRLQLELRYDRRRYNRHDASIVLRRFEDVIEALCTESDLSVADLWPEPASAPPPARDDSMAPKDTSKVNVGPRNDAERRLSSLWQSVLQRSAISMDDEFFDVGGDSMRAAKLFVMIDDAFEKRLPMTSLIHAPTIQAQAELLTGEVAPVRYADVVPIETMGSRPPLFFVHGMGGAVVAYREIAAQLSDQPIYGLQAPGVDEFRAGFDSADDLAEQLVVALRTVQPNGPYYVHGTCFGGLAFAIAMKLVQRGETIGMLSIVDSPPPERRETRRSPDRLPELLRTLKKRARSHLEIMQSRLRNEPTEGTRRREDFRFHLLWSRFCQTYDGPAFPGRIRLFYNDVLTKAPEYAHYTRRWNELAAGGVDVHSFPGGHEALGTGPGARFVANKIKMYMDTHLTERK